jgi:uncharacterized OB-fold protein
LRFSQASGLEISFEREGSKPKTKAHPPPTQETFVPELSYPLWSAAPEPALLASRERATGELVFPALPPSSPLADRHDTVSVEAVGEVYSYTVIHPGAKSGQSPYALGYVDFPGPVRIFGRLCGKQRPTIGERYAARADDAFGYVFVALDH